MLIWGDYRRGLPEEELKDKDISKPLSMYRKVFPCGGGAPTFWIINWSAAIVHLLNAFLTFILWSASDSKDNVFDLQETYTPWEERGAVVGNSTGCLPGAFPISDEWCIGIRNARTGNLSLWWLIIAFHFLSFAFQALAMAEWDIKFCGFNFVRSSYISEVDKEGTNSLRMFEYSISATLMQLSIALILSVWNALTLVGVASLTIVTMLLGLVAEKLKYVDLGLAWAVHLIGWMTMGGVWLILGRKFSFTISMAGEGATPPFFVYVIVIVIGVLYCGFGMVQFFDLTGTGTDKDSAKARAHHRAVELSYCMLSLISKTFLGWIIFSNALVGMARNN